MGFSHFRNFLFVLITSSFVSTSEAQGGLCPPNMDFEMGDFTNWICSSGTVLDSSGFNVVRLPTYGPIPGRHTIMSAANAGFDPYGGFPQLCPNGSQYSVMLGNNSGGHEAEGISYTYTIPAGLSVFSILFHYAVVLQNPNHTAWQQPRFRARIVDLSNGTPIPCVDFDFTATSGLTGFVVSPVLGNVLYKDWTPVSINLSAYIGKTIMLEFITSDCTFNAHFGYAYIDVNSACNGVISGTNICPGDTSVTLTAPFGFQSYQWYSDPSFSTSLASSQTLYLNPPPAVGSIFPVIVTPYPTFGCKDTLYATMGVGTRPISDAGPDHSLCQGQQVQIGTANNPSYNYAWSPPGLVSNSTISNPIAWSVGSAPAPFIVKTTDILTGCTSYDTTVITTNQVDTAIRLTGKNDFCIGDPVTGSLSVSNTVSSVQWYDNNGPIPGAVSQTYQPAGPGTYWAQVMQNGCTDSTASVTFSIHPIPLVSFTTNTDTACITNNSFQFTNTSTTSDGAPMSYNWQFSDGSSLTTTDAVKTFLDPGNYNIQLMATVPGGCKDSIQHIVHVFPNGIAGFTWDSICTNRPMLFHNLSNENGSVQVNYNWDFNNGGPASLVKNPLPVVYTTPGQVAVTLKMVNLGCETDPQTIIKTVLVNKQVPSIRYRTITVPEGSSQYIHVRDSIGNSYLWRPQMQLSSYTTRYTQFFATGNDVEYMIDMPNEHTCVTTDTIQMLVLKKPGYYLPTAFTPNGDGLNDVVKPYLVGMKSLVSFSIFNRWGNLVFFSKTEGEGWDGRYKGMPQDPAVYIWILEYIDTSDKKITAKGTITLIR